MKTFACGDVIPGCGARFTAADEDGIFAQVAGHAAADHGVTDITLSWCRRSAAASSPRNADGVARARFPH